MTPPTPRAPRCNRWAADVATPRSGGEAGSGVLGTTFGVGVFLVLLMFAAHLLLNLWVTSTVEAAAHDAALDVALSGATGAERRAAEARALERARASLGRFADQVRFE